jgi:flavodoxin
MKKAVVVYRSHSGVTRRYGEAIAAFLTAKGLAAQVVSVGECDMSTLADADYLFLGCWTSGLFVVRQRPDEPWLAFVRDMPALPAAPGAGPKVALFTTYKLRTGSQFPKMRAALAGKTAEPQLQLQSRNGALSTTDEQALEHFVSCAAKRPDGTLRAPATRLVTVRRAGDRRRRGGPLNDQPAQRSARSTISGWR